MRRQAPPPTAAPTRIPLRAPPSAGGGARGGARSGNEAVRALTAAAASRHAATPPTSPTRRAAPVAAPRVANDVDKERVLNALMTAVEERARIAQESKLLLQQIAACKRALVPYMRAHALPQLDCAPHKRRLKIGVKQRKRGATWRDAVEMVRADYGDAVAQRYEQRLLALAATKTPREDVKITKLGMRIKGECAGGGGAAGAAR